MPPRRARTGAAAWADRIVRGDARDVLEVLPRESVHLAITSPPYNLRMPYRGYDDNRSPEEYLRWLREVWRALEPVLVPGGRFVLNVAPTSIKNFRPIHHDLSRDLRDLGYIMRTEIIWYKQTMGRRTAWGSWRSPSNPHIIPSWEYVLVFSKGQWNLPGDRGAIDISAREFEAFSDGFWKIPPERVRKGHPAPFPEELIERLVKFYSYRGNVVLDMFGGTGTVAAVARRLGRHYLHIDASEEYCRLAEARVRAAHPPAAAWIPAPPPRHDFRARPSSPRAAGRRPPARARIQHNLNIQSTLNTPGPWPTEDPMPAKKPTGRRTSGGARCCGPDCCGGASSCCGASTAGPCHVDAVVAVDARGQMVIPKEIRTKFAIGPDDRLALVSWERDGTPCCLTLLRADELAESVRRTYGPVLGDAVAR